MIIKEELKEITMKEFKNKFIIILLIFSILSLFTFYIKVDKNFTSPKYISKSNLNPKSNGNVQLFSEDFEHGLSQWETITGLWHVTDNTSSWSNPYHSPTHSMWFGQESTGDYNTGSRVMGNLTSILIDLSSINDAYLEFYHWREGEGKNHDKSYVYISIDNTNWDLIYQTDVNITPWERLSFNLSQYCGNNSLRIRFYFDSEDSIANNFRGWLVDDIIIYTTKNLYNPNLTAGSVSPSNGNQSTLFTYTVNYTDMDNNPPDYVSVVINETAHLMWKQNLSDNNYIDGCIYEYQTYLNWGSFPYNYSFNCFDGKFYNETTTMSGPTVNNINLYSPILSNSGVFPLEGQAGLTNFNFTLNYTDLDNNPPININITLDGINYTMIQIDPLDNNYMDGCIFNYSTILNGIMAHEFNFTAYDGQYYVFDGTYTKPTTNDTIGPIISYPTVSLKVGASGTIFNFTTQVWDYTGINSVIGYVQNPDETNIDIITFWDDGNHNDGGIGDGLYGASMNSSGYAIGIYYLDINATDSTTYQYETEYENLLFAIINWSCSIGTEYRWNLTSYSMSPEMVGSHYIYDITEINITGSQLSSIWGNYSFYNISNGQISLLQDLHEIENYNLSSQLYEQLVTGVFYLPFLVLPINLTKVNQSLNNIITTSGSRNSYIYSQNNSIRIDIFSFVNYTYIFQWNNTGIMNRTVIYINNMLILQYDFIGPDNDPPVVTDVNVIPEIEVRGTPFNITAKIVDACGIKNATAIIKYPDLMNFDLLTFYDDGLHNDNVVNDCTYGITWDSTGKNAGLYNISINVTDNNGNWMLYNDVLDFIVTNTDISPPLILDSLITPIIGAANTDINFTFTARVWDPSGVSSVDASIQFPDEMPITSITMYDDGNHNDGNSGDGIFGNSWLSGQRNNGIIYIDVYCSDTIVNTKEYENIIEIPVLDWGVSSGEILIYNVTYNNLPVAMLPLSKMPVGYLSRVDLIDINSTFESLYGDFVSRLWGNSYYYNDSANPPIISSIYELVNNINWIKTIDMDKLVDLNITQNLYYNYLYTGTLNAWFTTIVPHPLHISSFQWLDNTGYLDISFPPPTFAHEITNSSILICVPTMPGMFELLMKYNEEGVLVNYTFDYLGYKFSMELIYYGESPHQDGGGPPNENGPPEDGFLLILLLILSSIGIAIAGIIIFLRRRQLIENALLDKKVQIRPKPSVSKHSLNSENLKDKELLDTQKETDETEFEWDD